MSDLRVVVAGIPLSNPLVVSSGPLTYDGAAILRAWEAGAAAAVTKTITLVPSVNPTPHIATAGVKGSLLNSEKASDLPAEQWIEHELPMLRRSGKGVVIASIVGRKPDVEALAGPVARAGAHALEVVGHYFQGADLAEIAGRARELSGLPVMVKVSSNWPDLLETIQACIEAGVDGFTACDSIGPALAIDINTARPKLEGPYGFGWLSGAAIKPITLRVVAQIALRCRLPVFGVGGVSTAEDVIEMMMAGATAVQVHSAVHLNGLGWFKRTVKRLDSWLDARGYASVGEVHRAALPWLRDEEHCEPLEFSYDKTLCTKCGRCVTVCSYLARTMPEGEMHLQQELCRSCGLCVSVCATGALRLVDRREGLVSSSARLAGWLDAEGEGHNNS
jgi:dihydroorotate dehydrogenase subfamily 1